MTEYAEKVHDAIKVVESKEYKLENGMQTDTVTVERERCYVKVIGKCGSLDSPSRILFKIVPKNGMTPDKNAIEGIIKRGMGLYGDVSVNIHEDNKCVVGI